MGPPAHDAGVHGSIHRGPERTSRSEGGASTPLSVDPCRDRERYMVEPQRRPAGLRLGTVHASARYRSEEHTSELQSLRHLVCRLLLEKKKQVVILGYEQTGNGVEQKGMDGQVETEAIDGDHGVRDLGVVGSQMRVGTEA